MWSRGAARKRWIRQFHFQEASASTYTSAFLTVCQALSAVYYDGFHDIGISEPGEKWEQKTIAVEHKGAIVMAVMSGVKSSRVVRAGESFGVFLLNFHCTHAV